MHRNNPNKMILLLLHQSFSLDKSHEPSMRFVFNKTHTIEPRGTSHLPIKGSQPSLDISDHRPTTLFCMSPPTTISNDKKKNRFRNNTDKLKRWQPSFVFPLLSPLLIMDLSVREKQNRWKRTGEKKIPQKDRWWSWRRGASGVGEINYCTPSLFRGFIKLAKRNFMAAAAATTAADRVSVSRWCQRGSGPV